MADWTTTEVRYLTEHYGIMTVRAIAKALGRSWMAVAKKANKLGLKSPLMGHGMEKVDLNDIRDHITDGLSAWQIARTEGVTDRTIQRRSKQLHHNIRKNMLTAGHRILRLPPKQRGVMPDDGSTNGEYGAV